LSLIISPFNLILENINILTFCYYIEDDQFKSQTDIGKLQYTLPSMMSLFGKTYEQFNNQDWFSYELSLMTSMPEMGVSLLKCATPANCRVSYSRFYTPVLYYVQPSVLYAGAEVAFWVDPRGA
jgi:hypothetical protein